IAVVHNGIIENHLELRRELIAAGVVITSDTDTEIVAHLISASVATGASLEQAVRAALLRVRGTYAIAVLSHDEPNRIIVSKSASPLVIGLAGDATLCGSDVPALLPHTRKMVF